MRQKLLSIRPFIGAEDFEISRRFYQDIGFSETILSSLLSVFKMDHISFYLQRAYVKDWIDNTMVFVEVEDVSGLLTKLQESSLTAKYKTIKLSAIKLQPWGEEFFLHDPSGILWHFGTLNQLVGIHKGK